MAVHDDRKERLTAILPRTYLLGLFLLPALTAPTTTDISVQLTPGVAVIDGNVSQKKGVNALDLEDGTLSDGVEAWYSVVMYRNPTVNGAFHLVVKGAEAASPVKPTDAEIEAAIEAIVGANCEYGYTLAGSVRVSRSGSTVTIEEIDHQVRSYGVDLSAKDPSATYNDTEILTGEGDAEVYRPWGILPVGMLAATFADGDLITDLPLPPIHGRIRKFEVANTAAVTTGGAAATLNMEIGTTDVTGGVVSLSGTYTLGAVVQGSAITADNVFKPGDTISIEASSVSSFSEGSFMLYVHIDELLQIP